MNDLQFGEIDDVAEILNVMPRELTDQDIKGVLINVCRRIAYLEHIARQAAALSTLGSASAACAKVKP